MAKKTVNSDIYNLSRLVEDVKSVFLPDENEETLAIGTYGYLGALEAKKTSDTSSNDWRIVQ